MNLPDIILVTGTDTGVGKTMTTAALTAILHGMGRTSLFTNRASRAPPPVIPMRPKLSGSPAP